MVTRNLMLIAAALGSGAIALANAPFATATFEKKVENVAKRIPVTSATMKDWVCFVIKDVSTPDGDHSYKLVVYDGSGAEVHQSINRITAVGGKWSHSSCVGYDEDRDVPGTWWYVAELDDQPLVSKELKVAAAG